MGWAVLTAGASIGLALASAAAGTSLAQGARLEMPARSDARVPLAPALPATPPDGPPAPVEHPCVGALSTVGLVLHPGAADAEFERAFARAPIEELVLARHRIRRIFQEARLDPDRLRGLLGGPEELATLARELVWLSRRIESVPIDPFETFLLSIPVGAALDSAPLEARYRGWCDEELGVELARLERALKSENDRLLDERIAAGQYEVTRQSAYG